MKQVYILFTNNILNILLFRDMRELRIHNFTML